MSSLDQLEEQPNLVTINFGSIELAVPMLYGPASWTSEEALFPRRNLTRCDLGFLTSLLAEHKTLVALDVSNNMFGECSGSSAAVHT